MRYNVTTTSTLLQPRSLRGGIFFSKRRPLSSNPQPQHSKYLLAHMNYARLKAPLEDPSMSEFRLALEPINALARATPGFVWSLDDQNNDSTLQRQLVPILQDDPLLMPQLSLWTNVQSIHHFAFKSGHAMYLKRKREWFTSPDPPWAVCWWWDTSTTTNNYPTLQDAFQRLELLKINGPTEQAFDFQSAKNFCHTKEVIPK